MMNDEQKSGSLLFIIHHSSFIIHHWGECMRQIGTLPDARDARAIADYLAGLSIEARLVESPGGWELWVCDEDKVPRAREEYHAFLSIPTDERIHKTVA